MHLMNLNDDEWTCKTATNVKESTTLILAGFQYITTIEGIQLFRKRKYPIFSLTNKNRAGHSSTR